MKEHDMTIFEYLQYDFELQAMAQERASAAQYVRSTAHSIVEHLIKRCMCSDSQYYNHWEKEITSWLIKWQDIKVKPKGKRLPYEVYKVEIDRWLDEDWELDARVKDFIRDGRLPENSINPYNPKKAYKAVKTLLDSLIQDVSTGRFVEFSSKYYSIPQPSELI